jgi:threonine dehydrogenase-like Zn-dependent dehydrogenase
MDTLTSARRTTPVMVQTGRRQLELRELTIPDVGFDDGILQVEATGICGSDWGAFNREVEQPLILGHEIVGFIDRVGAAAARKWGVSEGDRVVLEEYLPCGHCTWCRIGEHRTCRETDIFLNPGLAMRYGSAHLGLGSGLWGGYAGHLYLHPRTIMHPIAAHVPSAHATLVVPIANGVQWMLLDGGVTVGSNVLVIGPGQQGLGCVIAAKAAGAENIIVAGLKKDASRLQLAARLGATHTVDVESEDLLETVKTATNGELVDLVMDVAGGATTLDTAVEAVRVHGKILVAAFGGGGIANLPLRAIARHLTVKGVRGHSSRSVARAIRIIESGREPLHEFSALELNLEQTERGLMLIGGEGEGPPVVHASIQPNREFQT